MTKHMKMQDRMLIFAVSILALCSVALAAPFEPERTYDVVERETGDETEIVPNIDFEVVTRVSSFFADCTIIFFVASDDCDSLSFNRCLVSSKMFLKWQWTNTLEMPNEH